MIPEAHVDNSQLGFALLAIQAITNGMVALVLFALHRLYRRPFLRAWGVAWSALALFHLGTLAAAELAHLPVLHPARALLQALTLSAGYAQVTWLLAGAWYLVTGAPSRGRVSMCLALVPIGIGCASVFGSLWAAEQVRFFVRVALYDLLAGFSYLMAAGGVLRVARRGPATSRWFVSALFGLTGAAAIGGFLARQTLLQGGSLDPLLAFVLPHFLGLFLQLLLLSGLLFWFFEDEHSSLLRISRSLRESERQRRLQEHMDAVGRLAGGVAHDFNNLLTAIAGHTELLLNRAEEERDDREDLMSIAHATDRASDLVRELLTFSRRQPMRPTRFILDERLASIRKMLERLVGEDVRLTLELGATGAVLLADPGQIELAVINLASNARDSIAGNGRLTLRTSIDLIDEEDLNGPRDGRYVRLDVSDNGCGIPADQLGRIFEPFYTTKPGKGTGLGLASVYGITKQSGGEVHVESVPGGGTTFRLWFPVAQGPQDDVLVPVAYTRGGHETILLVEDDAQVRLLTHRQLVRAGYRVVMVENLDQAQECFADGAAFDLVLSDVVMPGRPLREFLEQLGRELPNVRVLLMSGYSESTIGLRGIYPDPRTFLTKPFRSGALLESVRSVLDADIRAPIPRTG